MGLRTEIRKTRKYTPAQIAKKQQAQIDKLNKMLMDNSEKQNELKLPLKRAARSYAGAGNGPFSILQDYVNAIGALRDEQTILEGLLEDEQNA